MKKLISAAAVSFWALPLFVFAQQINTIQDAGSVVTGIIQGVLVPLVFTIAFIVFIWGVFKYFIAGTEDAEAKQRAQHLMLYGIVGFFVMVSVWGLVGVLLNSFKLDNNIDAGQLPQVPRPR